MAEKSAPASRFMDHLGGEAFTAAMTAATLSAAAPFLAAKEGIPAATYIAREGAPLMERATMAAKGVGQAAKSAAADVAGLTVQHPTAMLAGDIGSQEGARLGGPIGEKVGVGSTVGAMLGATIGGGAGAILGGGTVKNLIKKSPDASGAIQPGADLEASSGITSYAKSVADQHIAQMDNQIKSTIQQVRVGNVAQPLERAAQLSSTVTKMRSQASATADQLWARVPMTTRVPMDAQKRLQTTAETVRRSISRFATKSQQEIAATVDKVSAMGPQSVPKAGVPTYGQGPLQMTQTFPNVTVKDLTEVRSEIQRDMRTVLSSGGSVKDPLYRNLVRLSAAVDGAINKTLPNNQALSDARKFSAWLHNRFDRGPLARIVTRNDAAKANFDPGTMQNVLNNTKFGPALADVGTRMNTPEVETRASQWVNNMFREKAAALDATGAGKGAKFLGQEKLQRFMAAFPKLAGRMNDVKNTLTDQMTARQTYLDSAFNRFAMEPNAQQAINHFFTGKDPAGFAKHIVDQFSQDTSGEAINQLRAGVLHEFVARSKLNPNIMEKMLQQQNTRNMLSTVLSSGQMSRMSKIIRTAIEIQDVSKQPLARRVAEKGLFITSRVVGAQIGRTISRLAGGGTIQVPQIFSNASKNLAMSWYKGMPTEELFVRAMIDPKWEKVLLSKAPETFNDLRMSVDSMKALLAGSSAAMYELQNPSSPQLSVTTGAQ